MNDFEFVFVDELGKEETIFEKAEFNQYALEKIGLPGASKRFGFVVKDGDAIIGLVFAKFLFAGLHIKDLVVAKAYRGKGLGSQLLKKAMQYGKEQGCTFAYLETLNFQAKDFYHKLGFVVDFERKGFDAGVSQFYMSKKL